MEELLPVMELSGGEKKNHHPINFKYIFSFYLISSGVGAEGGLLDGQV